MALPATTSSALLKLVRQRGTAWDLKRLRMALAPVAPDAIANGPATLRLTVRLHVSCQGVLVCWYVMAHLGCSRGPAVDVGRKRDHRVVRPAGGPCRGAAVVGCLAFGGLRLAAAVTVVRERTKKYDDDCGFSASRGGGGD